MELARDQKSRFRNFPKYLSRICYGGVIMIEKIKVRFLPDNITIETTAGESLLDAALAAGVFIPAACGGTGACAQCKVKVIQGAVKAESTEKIRPQERDEGFVLACQTRLVRDVTIEVPKAKVGRKVIPRDEAETHEDNGPSYGISYNSGTQSDDNDGAHESIVSDIRGQYQ